MVKLDFGVPVVESTFDVGSMHLTKGYANVTYDSTFYYQPENKMVNLMEYYLGLYHTWGAILIRDDNNERFPSGTIYFRSNSFSDNELLIIRNHLVSEPVQSTITLATSWAQVPTSRIRKNDIWQKDLATYIQPFLDSGLHVVLFKSTISVPTKIGFGTSYIVYTTTSKPSKGTTLSLDDKFFTGVYVNLRFVDDNGNAVPIKMLAEGNRNRYIDAQNGLINRQFWILSWTVVSEEYEDMPLTFKEDTSGMQYLSELKYDEKSYQRVLVPKVYVKDNSGNPLQNVSVKIFHDDGIRANMYVETVLTDIEGFAPVSPIQFDAYGATKVTIIAHATDNFKGVTRGFAEPYQITYNLNDYKYTREAVQGQWESLVIMATAPLAVLTLYPWRAPIKTKVSLHDIVSGIPVSGYLIETGYQVKALSAHLQSYEIGIMGGNVELSDDVVEFEYVEYFTPEITRSGARLTITRGEQEVDFHVLPMAKRDSNFYITDDVENEEISDVKIRLCASQSDAERFIGVDIGTTDNQGKFTANARGKYYVSASKVGYEYLGLFDNSEGTLVGANYPISMYVHPYDVGLDYFPIVDVSDKAGMPLKDVLVYRWWDAPIIGSLDVQMMELVTDTDLQYVLKNINDVSTKFMEFKINYETVYFDSLLTVTPYAKSDNIAIPNQSGSEMSGISPYFSRVYFLFEAENNGRAFQLVFNINTTKWDVYFWGVLGQDIPIKEGIHPGTSLHNAYGYESWRKKKGYRTNEDGLTSEFKNMHYPVHFEVSKINYESIYFKLEQKPSPGRSAISIILLRPGETIEGDQITYGGDKIEKENPSNGGNGNGGDEFYDEATCASLGGHWYDDACHSNPQTVPKDNTVRNIALGTAVVAALGGLAVYLASKK